MSSPKRLPNSIESYNYLISRKVPVNFIVDVGVLSCTYSLMKCFGAIKHILIEPVRSFYPKIIDIYRRAEIDFHLAECAAGSSSAVLWLAEYAQDLKEQITHSHVFDQIDQAPREGLINTLKIPVRRIDEILKELVESEYIGKSESFLLKVDVDGLENEVIKGASLIMHMCSVISVEVPIFKLLERVSFVSSFGYTCVDIVDLCYYKGTLSQVDCIFVKNDLMIPHQINPWQISRVLEHEQWYQGRYKHEL